MVCGGLGEGSRGERGPMQVRWENEVGRGLTSDKEGGDCGIQVGEASHYPEKGGFSLEPAGDSVVV